MAEDKNAKEYLKLLLDEGAKTPINDEDLSVEVPSFYDEKKFKRAQKFYNDNYFCMGAAMMSGLLAILSIPTILDVLIYTDASSVAVTAYRRYIATIFHTLNWFQYDLKPGTKCWKSIEAVKKLHAYGSRGAKKANVGFISQKDMAITQFGFIGYTLVKWKEIVIPYDKQDFEAFLHFWRVIGHMLNIEERFNVCTESLEVSTERLDAILKQVLRPALSVENKNFNVMTKAIFDGLWAYDTDLDYDAYMFIMKRLSGVAHYTYDDNPSPEEKAILARMSWWSRLTLYIGIKWIGEVFLKIRLFRIYYDYRARLNVFLIRYVPVLAVWKFGWKNAFVKV